MYYLHFICEKTEAQKEKEFVEGHIIRAGAGIWTQAV